jgi:protein O-GlcNAc transferase
MNPSNLIKEARLCLEQGKLDQAANIYTQLYEADKCCVDALIGLGRVMLVRQDHRAANEYLEAALRLNPRSRESLQNLGTGFFQLRRADRTVDVFRRLVGLDPTNAYARLNLGKVYSLSGKHEEAIGHLRESVTLDPSNLEARMYLCNALIITGHEVDAASCLESAKQYAPNNPELLSALAMSYYRLGRIDDTRNTCEEVLRLQPNNAIVRSAYVSVLCFDPGCDPERKFREHVRWGDLHAPASFSKTSYRNDRTPEKRLRIGYLSPNFHLHSVAYFLEPILAHHDKGTVETFCYANMEGSDSKTGDFMRIADHWRDIKTLDDAAVTRLIVSDEIDILVDLAGYSSGNRLGVFARKPAPIQVSYLGYPATTGMQAMDYRFTDEQADPHGGTEHLHTEKLWRLPGGFLCYQPPTEAILAAPPCIKNGYVTFGSFNNLAKVNADVIALWSGILNRTPGSRLLLKSKILAYSEMRERTLRMFEACGIGRERIELMNWRAEHMDHLDSYRLMDIALDTFPYNGTTTTCEALWMGVPVVTLAGKEHVSRVGVSILTHAGLSEFIANDITTYTDLAVSLTGNVEKLEMLRTQLRTRMSESSLCDPVQITRNIEAAYRTIWKDWVQNISV